jgi:LysR family transcriptional regulator, glycine cleavage system transcriptional activator
VRARGDDNLGVAMQQTINSHATKKKNSSMSYRLPPLNALRAFEAAARHLSFKTAAAELSVTPTAISHQIKLLEAFLGQPLFYRLTRALELTPQGEAMLPKVHEGLACFAAAVESAQQHDGSGMLKVVLPPSFATRWLVPRLKRFAQSEPALNLQIIRSLKAIDSDQLPCSALCEQVDTRQEDSLAVIRFGTGSYPGCQVDRMFGSDYIAVCSPKLLDADPPLRTVQDMRHQVRLHVDAGINEHTGPSWEEWFRLAGVSGVNASAGPHFSDSGLAYVAALDGLGVALASKPLVATALAQGRLVAPFDIAVAQNYAYYLVIPQAIANRPVVKTFRTWLLDEARAEESGRPG